ncbi:hypothetical protein ACVIW0_006260 [Bradyrhizobium sp. USDA 4454]
MAAVDGSPRDPQHVQADLISVEAQNRDSDL